jgi:hypothetical protein
MTGTISSSQKRKPSVKLAAPAINIYSAFNLIKKEEPLHIQLYKQINLLE